MNAPLEILLVEDNEGDVEMTRRALNDDTCRLSVVNDGVEALDYLRKQDNFQNATTPQLVLLDLNMPRMGGKDLLAAAKQDEQLKTIPMIVLTSSNAPRDILESYALHANCYLVKPFDGREFITLIRQAVTFWRTMATIPHG